jgi:transcriptional regulator EpsA
MHTEAAGLRVVRSRVQPGEPQAEQPELRLVSQLAPRGAAKDEEAVPESLGSALLDAQNIEGLLLNLDASLRITNRAQFFSWSQGLLLNLIRHRVLVCALRKSRDPAFTVDAFSTAIASGSTLADLLAREGSLLSALADKWVQRQFNPYICSTDEFTDLAGGAGLRELTRTGVTELLVHGWHDPDGEVVGLSIFACPAGSAGAREMYLAQLINPSLHAAWVRAQTRAPGADARAPANGGCILTERERGILRWVYLGKSNGEIGAILGISALTVKNHVQKILRKLNVVNRAQAVGRALDARIIRP